ncbi:hypothetical protein B1B04_09095 [Lysinibacillus sp. KCTC 33748]|nr:hypothetical protein B1B04_09095 [Lysinibacillus sp. KCTC 33748]SKB62168.1 hypothetical protein SAMN06295926_104308 [Lysinibacillus sp. AC-3]
MEILRSVSRDIRELMWINLRTLFLKKRLFYIKKEAIPPPNGLLMEELRAVNFIFNYFSSLQK